MNQMKEQQNQCLYQFLEKINQVIRSETNPYPLEKNCVEQYVMMVNTSFCANVLHKGLAYANRLYNHIIQVEYKRICRLIIRQELEKTTMRRLLYALKKAKKKLLTESPINQSKQGVDIFYQFIGGNRQRYQKNRNAINKIYQLLKQESNRWRYRYLKNWYNTKCHSIKAKCSYHLWLISSYWWHF